MSDSFNHDKLEFQKNNITQSLRLFYYNVEISHSEIFPEVKTDCVLTANNVKSVDKVN